MYMAITSPRQCLDLSTTIWPLSKLPAGHKASGTPSSTDVWQSAAHKCTACQHGTTTHGDDSDFHVSECIDSDFHVSECIDSDFHVSECIGQHGHWQAHGGTMAANHSPGAMTVVRTLELLMASIQHTLSCVLKCRARGSTTLTAALASANANVPTSMPQ